MTNKNPKTSYQPRLEPVSGKSGNYHRVHNEILKRANKDGSFKVTETLKAIRDELKINTSSVSSSIFQWSDPTGVRGVRRVRLLSPRYAASCPVEMPDATPPTTPPSTWANGHFPPPHKINKDGPFYISVGSRPGTIPRREQLLTELKRVAEEKADSDGLWNLRVVVSELCNLGFNPVTAYHVVKEQMRVGAVGRKHGHRFFKDPPMPPRKDPLSDPNSFKGAKTQEQINEERRPKGIPTGDKAAALDELITQLIQKKLEQPETLSLIDAFVKARMEEVIRRQLGL
jgi:hypothetical protein